MTPTATERAAIVRGTFEGLLDTYGPQSWWPADSWFEMMVGAVLTQNTAWTNAARALQNLKGRKVLSPDRILGLGPDQLAALLRPSGYYRLKADRVRALSQWLLKSGGYAGASVLETETLRLSLLEIKGVGPETADVILLYAFDRPVFVVDAYARRLFSRLGVIEGDEPYEYLRPHFESMLCLGPSAYNECHALIVRHAKEVCRNVPLCETCPFRRNCAHGNRKSETKR